MQKGPNTIQDICNEVATEEHTPYGWYGFCCNILYYTALRDSCDDFGVNLDHVILGLGLKLRLGAVVSYRCTVW